MAGAFVEDDAVVESWEGGDVEGVDFLEVVLEDLVEFIGAGVAVLVLADVDEESALEVGEGLVSVVGLVVGPGPEDVVVGMEGHGVGAGGWQYFDAGYGCHWDAVSVLRAGRMGVGGDDVHVVVDEFACEVAVAGSDFDEGISAVAWAIHRTAWAVMMGKPKRALYSRRRAVRSISVRVGAASLAAH